MCISWRILEMWPWTKVVKCVQLCTCVAVTPVTLAVFFHYFLSHRCRLCLVLSAVRCPSFLAALQVRSQRSKCSKLKPYWLHFHLPMSPSFYLSLCLCAFLVGSHVNYEPCARDDGLMLVIYSHEEMSVPSKSLNERTCHVCFYHTWQDGQDLNPVECESRCLLI